MQKDKRHRSQNWLNEDKVILKNLIKERIDIIANKNTDSNTNKKKEKAWDDLLHSFNKICVGAIRTLPQVKAQWGLMKTHAKKIKADKRKEQIKAGGGLPPSQSESEEIPIWLPIEVKIETEDSDTVAIVSTPDVPGPSDMNEFQSEKPPSPNFKTEKPAFPTFGISSTNTRKSSDSNDQWLCSDSNDNGFHSEVMVSKNEEAKKKIKNKKTVSSPAAAQSPAAQVAAVETECRREMHKMQMKIASLQVVNEEHKSRLLYLQEEVQNAKLLYYKRKMQFYSREEGGGSD